jgi:hypothetical protein
MITFNAANVTNQHISNEFMGTQYKLTELLQRCSIEQLKVPCLGFY